MPGQQAQQILWDLPDPLMALKNTFQIAYINSALEKMLGASLKQVQGKNIEEAGWKAGNDWKELVRELRNFSNGKADHSKGSGLKKNKTSGLLIDPLMPQSSFDPYHNRSKLHLNEKVYFYEIFKVFGSRNLNPVLVVLFREITEDIEINDQMVQAEKMSGLGTLAAGLAHELNNPLYTLMGFSEMILKENDKVKTDLIAEKIREKTKALVAILENFNSYIQLNPTDGHMTVNINERLDAALEIALLTHESKDITIKKSYEAIPFFKAKADEIQQVFFNIFANSIQAMHTSGELVIHSASRDREIVVTIQDTGEGVPKEYIAKVFDPFFTTKDQGEGTGLGLTAAYQLVKKYGGRIKFYSVQGEGTTVKIYWPVHAGIVR